MPEALTPQEKPFSRDRAISEWTRRSQAEYRSAARTSQLLTWMIQAGFPDDVVRTGHRIVNDELDHAWLSNDVSVALGAPSGPSPLTLAFLQVQPGGGGLFQDLTDIVVHDFCLGETFAVPLFAAMRSGTTAPPAKTALDRILKDEAVHRAFGWDAIDVLLDMDDTSVRTRLTERLAGWIASYEQAYGVPRETAPLSDAERAWGLLPVADYVTIFRTCLQDDIMNRFSRRGIDQVFRTLPHLA